MWHVIYSLIIFAGTPTAVTLFGISLVITVPAPIILSEPIFILGMTTVPDLKRVSLTIFTLPDNIVPGDTCTKLSNLLSCSMVAFVFIIQWFPIKVLAFMTTLGITKVP